VSKFRLNFTLKQHTPIIHFQSDQSGATLRATELKPKLDRFLLENVEGIPFKENANGSKSLDYKVKIEADLSHNKEIDARNPLFFGNMGEGEQKEFKEHSKTFKIEFFSFNLEVLEAIKNNFESFLANTNFGTRQSKGFGGFYLKKPFDKSLIPFDVYSFSSSSTRWQEDIKLFYAFLRQGINLPNRQGTRFYAKPAIFLYAKSKGWTWDKKAIKEHFFADKLREQQTKYNSESPVNYGSSKKYILRDLFGLSSEQSWMSYRATVKKETKNIDRFKSPITFKFVDGQVYFWANNSVEEILNKDFTVKAKGSPLQLKTPKEFSFDEFFKFVKNIKLSDVVENKFQSQREYKDLNRMLSNLKVSS